MSGKKTFDENKVLFAALNVFRLRGFTGAGLSELEAATGLNRSSLYNAYGNKQGLFVRALVLFREQITEMALKELERPRFRDALEAFLEASGAFSRPGFPGGCPHTIGSLEMGREGGKVSEELERGISAMIGRVQTRCARAVAEGDLPKGTDCEAVAALIIATTRGVVVLSMATQQAEQGQRAFKALIEAVCPA